MKEEPTEDAFAGLRSHGKFIRNRARKDGGKFLEGFKKAEACPPEVTVSRNPLIYLVAGT